MSTLRPAHLIRGKWRTPKFTPRKQPRVITGRATRGCVMKKANAIGTIAPLAACQIAATAPRYAGSKYGRLTTHPPPSRKSLTSNPSSVPKQKCIACIRHHGRAVAGGDSSPCIQRAVVTRALTSAQREWVFIARTCAKRNTRGLYWNISISAATIPKRVSNTSDIATNRIQSIIALCTPTQGAALARDYNQCHSHFEKAV